MALRIRGAHLLVAGGLVLAASPAFAQEGVLFQNLAKGLFGNGERDEIDYRQRPPLVVPPGSALPRPQDPEATRIAAWPNDPDVARRRADARAGIVPFTENPNTRNNPLLDQREIRRGRVVGRGGGPDIAQEHTNFNNQIDPIRIGRSLASRQNQDDQSNLLYGSEPPRRSLSEPPVGYRRPAASAALGPGQSGPREDQQAVGQREFLVGTKPLQ